MSIVELMISLTLGMVVLLLAGSLFLTANASFNAQREQAAVDDAGRFALSLLERNIRQAGFADPLAQLTADQASHPAAIAGMDAASLSRATPGMGVARAAVANGSDVLALRFAGSGQGTDGDGSTVNCAGFGVGAEREGWSIFYVGLNAAGQAELRCKYRGEDRWSADVLVAGIDSFQVLYGLDTDVPPDAVPNQYVTATALDTLDAGLMLTATSEQEREREFNRRTHWKRVASVRVALVLHGEQRTRPGQPLVFHLFGPGYSAAAAGRDTGAEIDESVMDGSLRERERRSFATTVLLRNPSR